MDNNPYNAPPEARYQMPSQLPERDNNTYNIPPTVAPTPQKSVFEQYPFHDWLVDHAKTTLKQQPYELNDEDIKRALDPYLNSVLGNQLSNEKGFANEAHFQKALDARKSYYGPLARARLEQDMPNLKAYLNGLRAQVAPEQTKQEQGASDVGEALATGAERSVLSTLRGLGMAGAGLAELAPKNPIVNLSAVLARKLGAKVPTAENIQDALFKSIEDIKKTEDALPQATTTGAKIAEFAGALPGAIISAGTGAPGAVGQNIIDQGGSLASAEGNAALSAILNATGIKGASLGTNPLSRAVLGGGTGGGLSAIEQLATTGKIDPLATALATGAGAAGGALTRGEGGGKAKGEEIPPTSEGQRPPGNAGQPANEGGATIAPDNVALSTKTKAKLNSLEEAIVDAETPEAARDLWSKHVGDIEEPQRQAAQNAFAEDWAAAHGRKPEELNAVSNADEAALAAAATEESRQNTKQKPAEQQPTAEESPQLMGKTNPLANAKPIDASIFTREHLADAERYHAEQDISKKGAIKKKIMDEAGLPEKDVEAFLDALKPKAAAPENPLDPKVPRR